MFVVSSCDFIFFKQKTAYDMRISDWSSDVCSSDLSCRNAPRSRDGGNSIDTPTTGQRMREGGCAMTHGPIGDDEMGDVWPSVHPGRGHDEYGSARIESAGPQDRKSTRLNSSP